MLAPQVKQGHQLVFGQAALFEHLADGLAELRDRAPDLVFVSLQRNVEPDHSPVLLLVVAAIGIAVGAAVIAPIPKAARTTAFARPRRPSPLTSEILCCSQGVGDLLHLLRSREADPHVESTTHDCLDCHDVREAMCSDSRHQQRLGVPIDQVHTQDGDTVALVQEVRAHDQSQERLSWTLEHGPVLPDLSATHPGRVPEAQPP